MFHKTADFHAGEPLLERMLAYGADTQSGLTSHAPLQAWLARLAPGFCSDATHGVIRVSHAVRSLLAFDSHIRRAELAARACLSRN